MRRTLLTRRRVRKPSTRLMLEPLEDRVVLNAGMLDPTFGQNGIVTTAISGNDEIHSLAMQSDGKIVAAGANFNDFEVCRYNTNGSLDTSFGTGGKAVTSIGTSSDRAYGMVIQANGKLVVAGYTDRSHGWTTDYDLAVVRYNANGTLDKTFNKSGKVTTSFTNSSIEFGRAVALQDDGKIVVVGQVQNPGKDVAVVRYNADGSLDSTFGSGGKISLDIASGSSDGANSIVIQSDGKMVIVGDTWLPDSNSYDVFLLRLNSNGTLDSSFGNGGKMVTALGQGGSNTGGLALQSDGKIVVGGSTYNGSRLDGGTGPDLVVARFNSNGTADTTFGLGGLSTIDLPNSPSTGTEQGTAVALQPDGKILAGGNSGLAGSQICDFALVRLNADGSLDTTFGSSGSVVTPIGTGDDDASAIALQSDGKIVLGGRSNNGTDFDFALARYLGDGSTGSSAGSLTVSSASAINSGNSLTLSGLAASSWPMYGLNPQHTGASTYGGSLRGDLQWTVAATNDSYILGPDAIYTNVGATGYDGSLLWTYPTGADGATTPALDSEGTLYTISSNGLLYALNSHLPGAYVDENHVLVNGVKWTLQIGPSGGNSPVLGPDGTLYLSSSDGALYAVNANGTLRWRFQTGQEIQSSPALSADGSVVYVGSDDNSLYAINASNGTKKWSYHASDDVNASPAVGPDGTVYITTSNWLAWAIAADGHKKWSASIAPKNTSFWAIGDPAVDPVNGTVYFGGGDGLYAYGFNGSLKWKYATPSRVWAHPAVGADAGRTVYFTDVSGDMYAVGSNGRLSWSANVGGSWHQSPVIGSDGTVYAGTYAFHDGGVGRPTIAWLQDSPDPLTSGGTLTLTAWDATDGNGTVQRVDFYRDADGNGLLDPAMDTLLGSVNSGGPVQLSVAVNLPAGTYTYFAVATDNQGYLSNVVSTTNTVAGALQAAAGPAAVSGPSNGQGTIAPSRTSISSTSSTPLSAVDLLFTNLPAMLSTARNAYQMQLCSVTATWQSADALALQRLDALLDLEAGAMGVTKDIRMRDLLFASMSAPNG